MLTRLSVRPFQPQIRHWVSKKTPCRALATTAVLKLEQQFPQPARSDQRGQRQRAPTNWVALWDVPKTALHNDVRRAVGRAGVDQKYDVYLDYFRFQRNGQAYLRFSSPEDVNAAMQRIGGRGRFQITAQDIICAPVPQPDSLVRRQRGIQGRAIAAQKGKTLGNGPDAGTSSRGRDVVLYGLPGKIEAEDVFAALTGFEINSKSRETTDIGNEGDADELDEDEHTQAVIKLPQSGRSLTSRHLVRLANTSEAHRLVRKLHMTYWEENIWGTKYMCRARVIY